MDAGAQVSDLSLPAGMMIVGRYGEDATVLQVAHAVERLVAKG
jgi:Asp-tRNA(Asn)/Glu-tRNA(Gln) amidotransferase A subunit family amidase